MPMTQNITFYNTIDLYSYQYALLYLRLEALKIYIQFPGAKVYSASLHRLRIKNFIFALNKVPIADYAERSVCVCVFLMYGACVGWSL